MFRIAVSKLKCLYGERGLRFYIYVGLLLVFSHLLNHKNTPRNIEHWFIENTRIVSHLVKFKVARLQILYKQSLGWCRTTKANQPFEYGQ